MNLILKKKYRIYRSVMATFEGWEIPPKGLNIGDIVSLSSIEDDKNVVVKTEEGAFWYVRYTSLANIEGEDEAVEDKKKEEPFDWAAYNKLIKGKRNPLPALKWKGIDEYLLKKGGRVHKYVKDTDGGLCSFVYNGVVELGYVCYAPAMRYELSNFGVSFGRLRKEGFDTPEVRRYVEWISNESHFSRYFTKHTFDDLTKECHWFICPNGESKAVIAAACMVRCAYEYPSIPAIFCELVDAGVEESMAYIIATLTRNGNYDAGTGHTSIYSASVDVLVKQALRSLACMEDTIYKVSGHSDRYGSDVCQLKEAFIKLEIAEKDAYGYVRVQKAITKEERLKAAEVLATFITKEIGNA